MFVCAVSLLETFTWISYYLLWRNFAEPRYTLYHPAEYFVLLPVVIALQALDLAILHREDVGIILLLMADARDEGPTAARVLGQFYLVVIIANLLRMFPETRFKAPTVVNIIGAGQVVTRRIVPAFLRPEGRLTPAHIHVHTVEPMGDVDAALVGAGVKIFPGDPEKDLLGLEESIICRVVASAAPAVIASPSPRHFAYAVALSNAGLRFAIEKPLSIYPDELRALRENRAMFDPCMFALSYYALEKALPLTYLLSANHHYADFLCFATGAEAPVKIDRCDVTGLTAALGPLESLRVDLLEGSARSPTGMQRRWTEENGVRGLAYETMIHPLTVAQKLLSASGHSLSQFVPERSSGRSDEAREEGAVTFLRLDGQVRSDTQASVGVTLTCGKYMPAHLLRRGGTTVFRNGVVSIDFDSRTCAVELSSGAVTTISVSERYAFNYAVQMELVSRFFDQGWKGGRFDDLDDQLVVLEWLAGANLETNPFRYNAGTRVDMLQRSVGEPSRRGS